MRPEPAPLRGGYDVDDNAIRTTLGAIVESAGRSCAADRRSLVSGLPFWQSVKTRVLACAEEELARLNPEVAPVPFAV